MWAAKFILAARESGFFSLLTLPQLGVARGMCIRRRKSNKMLFSLREGSFQDNRPYIKMDQQCCLYVVKVPANCWET